MDEAGGQEQQAQDCYLCWGTDAHSKPTRIVCKGSASPLMQTTDFLKTLCLNKTLHCKEHGDRQWAQTLIKGIFIAT